MKPLKESTVYVPVSVNEELPVEGTYCIAVDKYGKQYSCFYNHHGQWMYGYIKLSAATTHWLKEQQGYFLTRDEMEKLLAGSYSEGAWQEQDGHHAINTEAKMRTEYIKSILP